MGTDVTSSASRPTILQRQTGVVLKNRYLLETLTGIDGSIEVWRGRDLTLERHVSIKVLQSAKRANSQGILDQETAARLSHPHIVPTYDAGVQGDISFVVQGLTEGPTLFDVLSKSKLNTREALYVARQVTSALNYANQEGVSHRGISSAKIFVLDGKDRIMITDFGISGDADASESNRGDIRSVGCLLHDMVCPEHQLGDVAWQSFGCSVLPEHIATIVRHSIVQPGDEISVGYETMEELSVAIAETEQGLQTQGRVFAQSLENASQSRPAKRQHAYQEATSYTKGQKVAMIGLALSLVAISIGVGRLVAEVTDSPEIASSKEPTAIPIASVHSFDPKGDKNENDEMLGLSFDKNPQTSWSTDTYSNRKFGNLKPGLGLVVELNEPASLDQLTVESTSDDWAASAYVSGAATSPTTLETWNSPVDSRASISGAGVFDLQDVTAKHVLVWITDLGTSNRLTIPEIRITAH